MKFKINGKECDIDTKSGFTIDDLIKRKKLNPENIVVEYNFNIVDKNQWASTQLKQGDNIEIVSFVGGG